MISKKLLLIFTLTSMFIFASCGSRLPFDPRAYNQTSSSTSGEVVVTPAPDIEVEIPDEENDPFKFPENLDPNENFDISKFDNWLIRASFNKVNAPTYWYAAGDYGSPTDSSKNQYTESGAPSSEGGGYAISSMVYYMYQNKNPLYEAYSSYNTDWHGERMERFLFYRFTGSTLGPSLDNFLIAVDTYKKLVFAFAIPTSYSYTLGNAVPSAWGSVDSIVQDGKYMFYEYDPVGIVTNDGTFELYEWYMTAMANADYTPVIGDPTREIATYGSPGRSPYIVIDAEAAAASFAENAAGKVFSYRGQEGASEYLHTYTFSSDAETLTYALTRWGQSSQTVLATYTSEGAVSGTIATYSGRKITLSDDFVTLDIDGETKGTTSFAQSDPGPFFKDRVKLRIYNNDSGTKLEFNGDATEVQINNGKTYSVGTYSDDYSKGYYDMNDIGTARYQMILSTDSSIDPDKYSATAIENVLDLDYTDSQLVGGSDETTYLASGFDNTEMDPELAEDLFLDALKGRIFRYRDSTLGKSEILHIYTVSSDGKTITYSTQEWRQNGTTAVASYTFTSATSATEAIYNGSMVVTIAGDDMSIDGKIGRDSRSFSDTGPWFRDRVKGQTFEGSGFTYEFSSEGETITINGGDNVYTYSGRDSYTFAEYVENYNLFDLIPMSRYWGVQIDDDTSFSATPDNRIRWTTSLLTADTHALPSTATYSSAWIGGDSQFTDEDRYLYNIGSGGHAFYFRSADISYSTAGVINNYDGSLFLQAYESSADGRTLTKYRINYDTGNIVTNNGVYNEEYIFNSLSSTDVGRYVKKDGSGSLEVEWRNGGIHIDGTVSAYKDYTDEGPVFQDRVAGRTYKNDDGTTLAFNKNATTVQVNGGSTYDVSDGLRDGGSRGVVGWYGYGSTATEYYNMRLSTSTSLHSVRYDSTARENVLALDHPTLNDNDETLYLINENISDEDIYLEDMKAIAGNIFKYRAATLTYNSSGYIATYDGSLFLQNYAVSSDGRTLTKYRVHYFTGETVQTETFTYSRLNASDTTKGLYVSSSGQTTLSVDRYDVGLRVDDATYYTSYSDPGPVFQDIVAGRIYAGASDTWKFNSDGTRMLHTAKYHADLGDDYSGAYYVYGGGVNESAQAHYMGCYGRMTSYSSSTAVEAMKLSGSNYETMTFSSLNVRFDMHSESGTSNNEAILWDPSDEEGMYLDNISDKTFKFRSANISHNESGSVIDYDGSLFLQHYQTSADGRSIYKYRVRYDTGVTQSQTETYTFSSLSSSDIGIYTSGSTTIYVRWSNGGIHIGNGSTETVSAYTTYDDPGPGFQDIVAGRTYVGNGTYRFNGNGTRMNETSSEYANWDSFNNDYSGAYYIYGGRINESSQPGYMGCLTRSSSYSSSATVRAIKVSGDNYGTLTFSYSSLFNVAFPAHQASQTTHNALTLWKQNLK